MAIGFGLTSTTALLTLLEMAINAALKYDPGSRAALEALEDTLLQVACTQPSLSVFVTARRGELYLSAAKSVEADAVLRGTLADLIALANTSPHSLAHSGVASSGNLHIIGAYQKMLANMDIDWQAMLAQVTGDLASHQVGAAFNRLRSWVKASQETIPQHVSDFLQHEIQVIPTESEVAYFCQQVDELRSATDRLQAKLAQHSPANMNRED